MQVHSTDPEGMQSPRGRRSKLRRLVLPITAVCVMAVGGLALAPISASSASSVGGGLLGTADAQSSPAGDDERVSPPSGKVTVDVVTVNGSGCSWGTANVAMSEDETAFTVTYSDFLVKAGADAKPTDFRRNCQINAIVHVPGGFTYAVDQVDYRGYAYLEKGAHGEHLANYYFQGMSGNSRTSRTFTGSHDDDWQVTDQVEVASMVWAPCGAQRNLNINTELRVYTGSSDPASTSFMSMDSTDSAVSTVYHLVWKKCTA